MNEILNILTGQSDTANVIEQGFNAYTTGCLIKTKNVYNICKGLVWAIEKDPRDSNWVVTIQTAPNTLIRYAKLSSVDVSIGDRLNISDSIGLAYKGIMRLEYCNSNKSQFPVRILNRQLYKHDPSPIIFGQINPSEEI